MSKYDSLKEDSDVFTGVRLVGWCTTYILTNGRLSIIQGIPACPECGTTLSHRITSNEWKCGGCDTEWTGSSLVIALRNERAIANINKEATDEKPDRTRSD